MKLVKIIAKQNDACDLMCIEVVTEEDFEILMKAVNTNMELFVCDVGGKHSEESYDIGNDIFIEVVTENIEKIEQFRSMFPNGISNWDILLDIKEQFEYNNDN